jgi:hypothetical protein
MPTESSRRNGRILPDFAAAKRRPHGRFSDRIRVRNLPEKIRQSENSSRPILAADNPTRTDRRAGAGHAAATELRRTLIS